MFPRLFVFFLPVILLLTACKPETPALLPVTGGKNVSAPAQVEMARAQVLSYVLTSSRLATLPGEGDWRLEVSERSADEYHFRSGDWLIMIWLADAGDGNQRVIILNEAESATWTGYVTAEGHVVDTHYAR